MADTTNPTLTVLSLGAGVQSTALLLMSALGTLPRLDAAIFSDTGWEPAAVYRHLDRIQEEIAGPAGIPVYRVSAGNIRNDALDPEHRFASMPLFVKNQDGGDGMIRRQCTGEYKLKPIKRQLRTLLGAQLGDNGVPGRVPRGAWAEQWIGISTDEMDRALDKDGNLKAGDVKYSRNRYPLIEQGMDRDACLTLLSRHGFAETPKSACIGCPFHTNRQWRQIRENPAEWADAIEFDAAIRAGGARANAGGSPLLGQAYLHRSRVPLSEAPIDRVTAHEWASRQSDALQVLALQDFEESLDDDSTLNGCSPFSCRGGDDE